MLSPTDIHGVKRFWGMVQYLARFVPNLARLLESQRQLTEKDLVWDWNSDCENALNEVKRRIAQPPILTFYD